MSVGVCLRKRRLSPGLCRIPGFRIGTTLKHAGLRFGVAEKLDKHIKQEHQTETHENEKKPHGQLKRSVRNRVPPRFRCFHSQGITKYEQNGIRLLRRSQGIHKDFVKMGNAPEVRVFHRALVTRPEKLRGRNDVS